MKNLTVLREGSTIIVCWNMQGTGYASADAFAALVAGWQVDIWLGNLNTAGAHSPDDRYRVLKSARSTTRSGAPGGSPRDKVLVRTGSDLVARATAGRVIGRNAMAEDNDWQIQDWDVEASSDHCPVYINTGGAAPAAAAAAVRRRDA